MFVARDWIAWYGPHAWVSLSTMQAFEPGPRLNLFTVMPASVFWVQVLFWVFVASTVCLTIGFLTRLNSVVVYRLPRVYPAEEFIYSSWRRHVFARGWIFFDFLGGGSGAVCRPADSDLARKRRRRNSAAKTLGATHDSVGAFAGVFRGFLLESGGGDVGTGDGALVHL